MRARIYATPAVKGLIYRHYVTQLGGVIREEASIISSPGAPSSCGGTPLWITWSQGSQAPTEAAGVWRPPGYMPSHPGYGRSHHVWR